MIELIVKVLASYLLGSLIGSLIVGRLRGGVDIRKLGSGNAGGTNALRTQGKSFAFWVLVIDIGKGVLATGVIAPLALQSVGLSGADSIPSTSRDWLPVACGLAAILGHVYPMWHGFRGGKGVATLVGVLAALGGTLLIAVLLVWLAAVMLFGFVGLASMLAAAALPLIVVFGGFEPRTPLLVFGVCATVLLVFTHRANIARMNAGTEPRARRLWLFGRGRAT